MWITTKPVTTASITDLIPRSRKSVRTVVAMGTSCANRGSCVATARTGGSMKSRSHYRNSKSSGV
jgi:hypothetical protein